jgi:hypothetical protein
MKPKAISMFSKAAMMLLVMLLTTTPTWAQDEQYNLGNCWHKPGAAQPAGTYMRNPIHPYATLGVSIYTGNQAYGDGGNPGDQSGGTIYYRAAGATAWQTAAMEYYTAIGDNKYWRGTIPADEFAAASTVEYVIKVTYDEHDDTYLGLAAAGDVASGRYRASKQTAVEEFLARRDKMRAATRSMGDADLFLGEEARVVAHESQFPRKRLLKEALAADPAMAVRLPTAAR